MRLRFLGLLALFALTACNSGGPAVTPVSGTILLGDQPLVGARVSFLPQGDTLGHGGAGLTGEDGKYVIVAHRNNERKGLLPGDYKVVVSRMLMPDGSPLPPNVGSMDSGAQESIPEPYSRRDITPFSATVGAEAKTFDFVVKTKKK